MNDENEDYMKARKGFLGISLFIILFRTLELKVGNLTYGGNTLTIGKPEYFGAILFLLFLYFAWRFTASASEKDALTNLQSAAKSELNSVFREFANTLQKPDLDAAKGEYISGNHPETYPGFSLTDWTKPFQHREYFYVNSTNLSRSQHERIIACTISARTMNRLKLKALRRITARQTGFIDTIFPYIFGFIAILELCGAGLVQGIADAVAAIPGWIGSLFWKALEKC